MMDLGQSAKVTDDLQTVSGSMFIRVRRNSLLKSLNRAQGISEKKSINPLFANILLQAQDSRLFLHSANISLLLEDSIAADVKMPGTVSVNASMLYEICRKLPESSELHIEQKESTLTIKSLAAQFELPIFENTHINSNLQNENDPNNKPIMVLLETEVLRNILAKVYFAASVEEVRSYLCGVHIEINGLKLAAVATDGHRLACIETCLEQKEEAVASEIIGATIPRKTIAELMRMLKDEEGNIEIAIMQNKITFGWGVIKLTSDLIASKFPPYRSVIPTIDDISNIMTVPTNIFRESIDRISLVSSEKRAIKLNIENNNLTISAAATENGRATESLMVQYNGKPLSISFNAKYLLEALYNIEDHNVDLYLRGQTDAVRIIDKKCTDSTYVVMPMRL